MYFTGYCVLSHYHPKCTVMAALSLSLGEVVEVEDGDDVQYTVYDSF